MFRKNLFKTAVIGFITSLTLTGCSLQIKISDNTDGKSDLKQQIETISVKIDDTDLTNEDEVSVLVDDINEVLNSENYEFQKAKLVRVVDGDTIVVDIEGTQAKVRLIGIDTPESVASKEYLARTGKVNSEAGIKASDYTKTLLENTEYVYLQKDVSDTDRYGRLLRFVWLEVPNDCMDIEEIATKMLNGMLVADHVAEVTPYKPDITHNDDFKYIYDHYEDFDR